MSTENARDTHFFLAGWNGNMQNANATTHFQQAMKGAPAHTEPLSAEHTTRSDAEALARAETAARFLLGWKYGQMPASPDTLLRQSARTKAQWAWNAACKLLRFIDGRAPAEVPAVAAEPMGQAAPGTQAIEPAATVAPQLADVPEWGELAKRIDEGGALTPLEQFIHDNEEAGPGADAWRKSVVDMVQHYAAPAVPAPAADAATPVGFALVPLRMTRAMDEVLQQEGWQWEDLLAAAMAVTEEQYEAIARDWLSRDAFTHAELLELRRAADEFADGIDTDVDHDLLARGAIANYLYCERFTVMDTDALDAAIAAQEALQ